MKYAYAYIVGCMAMVITGVFLMHYFSVSQSYSSITPSFKSPTVTLYVSRMNDSSKGVFSPISGEVISHYPSLVNAMREADKKYDAYLKWCYSNLEICRNGLLLFEHPREVTNTLYVTKIDAEEARKAITNLNFSVIPQPLAIPQPNNVTTATIYGIEAKYDDKYYTISIKDEKS